jgi:hypothetical protein
VEVLTKFGIFGKENSPLVEIVKKTIESIDFEGR